MKAIDVAFKDLLRSTRSAIFYVFGFGVPLLTGLLFFFAFGNVGEDDNFELPSTQVWVVNLDESSSEYGGFSVGQLLVEVLSSDELRGLLQVTLAQDANAAREAVDRQEAQVALIIPEGLTATAMGPGGSEEVELYQDPTLTLGPGIVKGIISQLMDGFAGSKIAAGVAGSQLSGQGVAVDQGALREIAAGYAEWAAAVGEVQGRGENPLIEVRPPAGLEVEGGDLRGSLLATILSGMMVFFVFFTGAASAQSILLEEEEGTLPRLFTTPTTRWAILGGKFIAVFITLFIQVVALLIITALLFRIDWGEPLPVSLVTLGLVLLSASFGIFITSLLRNTRQSGVVFGGVMTAMGMVGMMSTFSAGSPNTPQVISTAALLVPQGWAVRAWQLLLERGGGLTDEVLLTVGVMLAQGAVFFALGVLRFRKRYA